MEQESEQKINTNCGIYLITNLINGKVYIGQSINLKRRWYEHKYGNYQNNNPIDRAFLKYGRENFKNEILEFCLPEELNEKEKYWIHYYDSNNPKKGYNVTYGGNQSLKFNYEAIYNKWQEGYLCKELEEIFNCCDEVIHNALLAYGITQNEIYERGNFHKVDEYYIIALSPIDKKPLKIFDSLKDVKKILNLKNTSSIWNAIKNPNWKANGYYWIKSKEYIQIEETISDKDFIQNAIKKREYTEQTKIKLSFSKRKVERPSREEFKELIRTISFTEIGQKYGVTDNAVRKWCDFYDLPRRKKDINIISDENWKLL